MKGYRTFAVAFLTALHGGLQLADTLPWAAEWSGIINLVLGAALIALRFDTNTPPGKSA